MTNEVKNNGNALNEFIRQQAQVAAAQPAPVENKAEQANQQEPEARRRHQQYKAREKLRDAFPFMNNREKATSPMNQFREKTPKHMATFTKR